MRPLSREAGDVTSARRRLCGDGWESHLFLSARRVQHARRERAGAPHTGTGLRCRTRPPQTEIKTIADICHQHGALLVLDCVTSLGGMPVEIDNWGVDFAYSATQKSLSAPPGLAPITMSLRAHEIIENRKSPPSVFYLDLN